MLERIDDLLGRVAQLEQQLLSLGENPHE
jgi:hypothetical protein